MGNFVNFFGPSSSCSPLRLGLCVCVCVCVAVHLVPSDFFSFFFVCFHASSIHLKGNFMKITAKLAKPKIFLALVSKRRLRSALFIHTISLGVLVYQGVNYGNTFAVGFNARSGDIQLWARRELNMFFW